MTLNMKTLQCGWMKPAIQRRVLWFCLSDISISLMIWNVYVKKREASASSQHHNIFWNHLYWLTCLYFFVGSFIFSFCLLHGFNHLLVKNIERAISSDTLSTSVLTNTEEQCHNSGSQHDVRPDFCHTQSVIPSENGKVLPSMQTCSYSHQLCVRCLHRGNNYQLITK